MAVCADSSLIYTSMLLGRKATYKQTNTRILPTVLLTPSLSKAADMAHLCVPQNQALGFCRRLLPYIQVCGTHGKENLVNATITSNTEEEEEDTNNYPSDIQYTSALTQTLNRDDRSGLDSSKYSSNDRCRPSVPTTIDLYSSRILKKT